MLKIALKDNHYYYYYAKKSMSYAKFIPTQLIQSLQQLFFQHIILVTALNSFHPI